MDFDDMDIWLLEEATAWHGVALSDDDTIEFAHVETLVAASLLRRAINPPNDGLHYFALTVDGQVALDGLSVVR